MRGSWQLAIVGAAIAAVVLVVSGFLLFEHGGKSSSAPTTPSGTPTTSYGNAQISAKTTPRPVAQGGPFQRIFAVRPKDKHSGVPIHGAKVTIQGEMLSPHHMGPFYVKKLREVAPGDYEGPYTLVMAGTWRVVIVVRTKKGDTSTRALPVRFSGQ
jgi:hypothetical protein